VSKPSLPEIDALNLTCLRADHKAEASTNLFSVAHIPESFLQEHEEVLTAPEFCFKPPQYMSNESSRLQAAVLNFDKNGRPSWCFNMNGMFGTTERARRVLQGLSKVMAASHVELQMVPGQAVFINNHTCLHSRGRGFEPKFDGTDRWLLRSFWSHKPRASIINE